ncbi:MAG: nitroreductase [Thermodesulfobacteriota bacterium]
MDLIQAIENRRSIRGFKPDPVPRAVIREILSVATRAPSANNTQPWEFAVLAGPVLDAVREENVAWLRSGRMIEPEHPVFSWPKESVFRQRQVNLARDIFSLMGIKREDKVQRDIWMERGFRYFDAPAAIFVLTDRSLGEHGSLMDIGAVVQTICLAALPHGLGTCIEDQGVLYPKILRTIANFPENKRVVISIAIGYPDPDFPANRLKSTREPVESITTFFGLGD